MPTGLRINARLTIPDNEIELRASRSSGPGGQHANVTASRVEAVFEIADSAVLSRAERERLQRRFGPRVTAVAQDSRGQARNRELARERLATKIAGALRPPKARRPTRPTKAAKQRRLDAKRRRSDLKRSRRRPDANE